MVYEHLQPCFFEFFFLIIFFFFNHLYFIRCDLESIKLFFKDFFLTTLNELATSRRLFPPHYVKMTVIDRGIT
jgi:hypothetical protein